jgi:imidazolonepropionase
MQKIEKHGIGPFAQLITMRNLDTKGPIQDGQLEIIPNAGLIIQSGRVVEVDGFQKIRDKCKGQNIPIDLIDQPIVGFPALIDAHTHICFAGSRSTDYAKRVGGRTYLEIAKEGGGIWDTVQKTRQASQEELENGLLFRVNTLSKMGIATVEVKSGYGLNVKEELKMLQAIQNVASKVAIDLIPTCLPAHILPRDFDGTAKEYVHYLLQEFFPIVQQRKLSNRADIFVEETAFDLPEARLYLSELQKRGFDLTIHADQFGVGGSQLGVEFGARSVDHLEASGDKQIALLAQSDVIPVALPGASLGLGEPFAPARKLLDAGASLAIASDWNPGSAPMGNLLVQASILGAYEKLSIAETLAGLTFRAAAALGLNDRGKLERDQLADITAFPTHDYREIFYRQGQLLPSAFWKNGSRIF